MSVEAELFKKYRLNEQKLIRYGFADANGLYTFEKNLPDINMKAVIYVHRSSSVSGKMIDLATEEEYVGIHTVGHKGKYAAMIRSVYLEILEDIAEKCFERVPFGSNQANAVYERVRQIFHDELYHPFTKKIGRQRVTNMEITALKPSSEGKIYAIFMTVERYKIDGGKSHDPVEIINLKAKKDQVAILLRKVGIYRGFHMNKQHWITIILDEKVSDEQLWKLLRASRNLVEDDGIARHYWVVPANPSLFDIDHAFSRSDELYWKQRANYHIGDYLFIYYGMPYGEIRYLCRIIEKDIISDTDDFSLPQKKHILIKKVHFFDDHLLKRGMIAKYELTNIRGARSMPESLIRQIRRMYPQLMI